MAEPTGTTTKKQQREAAQPMLGETDLFIKVDGDFKQWWSVARQSEEPPSAHNFLVHLGLNQELVQKLLWEAMAEYCPLHPEEEERYYQEEGRSGPGFLPGGIDYYSRRLFLDKGEFVLTESLSSEKDRLAPKPFSSFPQMLEAALTEGASRSRYLKPGPIEQDLLSLAQLTSKACHDSGKLAQVAAQQCMRHKTYSAKFVQSLMKILPVYESFKSEEILGWEWDDASRRALATNPDSPIRYCMDHECILIIQRILDNNVKSVTLTENFWTEGAFKECLHLFSQTTDLEELTLAIPEYFLDDPGSDFSPLSAVDGSDPCGIKSLELRLVQRNNNTPTTANPGAPLAFQSIFSMPNLRHLTLNLNTFPLENAAPYLLRTIRETGLSCLQVTVQAHDAHDNNNSLLLDMLAALKDNSSLEQFCYSACVGHPRVMKPFNTVLLKLLQEHNNTTLLDVQLFSCFTRDLAPKINYYLGLNKHGRALSRDTNTEVKDFVANLSEFLESMLPKEPEPKYGLNGMRSQHREKRASLVAFQISYGLLRGLPGSWSNHVVCPPPVCPPSKRRKLL